MEKKAGKRKKYIVICLMVLVVAVFAVLLLSGRLINTDRIKRAFAYMREDKNEAGQLAELTFLNQQSNAFADYGGGLAIASLTGCDLIAMDGGEVLSASALFTKPAVLTAGEIAVFYDIGGTGLLMYDGGKQLLELTTPDVILSASLSPDGWLAVVAGESGYKSGVTVYDNKGQQVFKLYISSSYITDAAISEDHKYLIAAGVMYGSDGFCTKLMRYDLESEKEVAAVYVADTAIFDVACMQNDVVCALSDTAVLFCSGMLEQTGLYPIGSYYLARAAFSSEGFATLLLREQRSGNRAIVVSVGAEGQELGRMECGTEILDLSACGKYIALLHPDSAAIYREDMTLYNETDTTGDARTIIMREDGTLMLISSDTARLFVG